VGHHYGNALTRGEIAKSALKELALLLGVSAIPLSFSAANGDTFDVMTMMGREGSFSTALLRWKLNPQRVFELVSVTTAHGREVSGGVTVGDDARPQRPSWGFICIS
jgi:hypothetical protein